MIERKLCIGGRRYESINDAWNDLSRPLGISLRAVRRRLRHDKYSSLEEIFTTPVRNTGMARPIMVMGKNYPSISAAWRELSEPMGLSLGAVSNRVNAAITQRQIDEAFIKPKIISPAQSKLRHKTPAYRSCARAALLRRIVYKLQGDL